MLLCMDCRKNTEQEIIGREPDGVGYRCLECGKVYVKVI